MKGIIKEIEKFKKHPLGGIFYPKWMEEISKEFEKTLRDERLW